MARIRTVKPDFWDDVKLGRLSRDARLLFIALFNFADDEGRLTWDERWIKARVFPFDDDLTALNVRELMDELTELSRVAAYEVCGETFAEICNFTRHQRVNRPVPSSIPPPVNMQVKSAFNEDSVSTHESLNEDSVSDQELVTEVCTRERKGKEGKGKERINTCAFDEFWNCYPRKVAKAAAEKAWARATAKTDPDRIIAGARRLARDPNLPGEQFIPHASTWLNGDRWDDPPLPQQSNRGTDAKVAGWLALASEPKAVEA